MLEKCIAIQEISKTISSLKDGDSEAMYDNFVMYGWREKKSLPEYVSACDTVRLYKKTHMI